MSEPYFVADQDWLSDCCGAVSEGQLYGWVRMRSGGECEPMVSGRCSKCHENTNFTKEETKPETKGK